MGEDGKICFSKLERCILTVCLSEIRTSQLLIGTIQGPPYCSATQQDCRSGSVSPGGHPDPAPPGALSMGSRVKSLPTLCTVGPFTCASAARTLYSAVIVHYKTLYNKRQYNDLQTAFQQQKAMGFLKEEGDLVCSRLCSMPAAEPHLQTIGRMVTGVARTSSRDVQGWDMDTLM